MGINPRMRKLAVFVEGYTEVIFIERFIKEIAGAHNVVFEKRKIRGGNKVGRTSTQISAANPNTGHCFYILIMDCGNDSLVKTRILEEHENLTRSGYSLIIGMRDVRPDFTYGDIPRLEIGMRTRVKTSLIPVVFILSVMEIEAWFLSEFNHFPKIHPSITVPSIKAALGFDPEHDDLARRPTPKVDLNNCYNLGGETYQTSKAAVTVSVLDYSFLYLELKKKITYLEHLTNTIDGFLA